ncbi:unnamed protein product [Cylindrotheca closterium]|uniref:Uncharacterized protein n=1 Tax=Cylindrotheca closterium TaxID=2856 RepID=A0AAD2FU72_9STRA|nr:unnamed protein product [Cylindrotheca closterium]
MSRQLDRPTGVVGILILLCVAFNIYAAYNVPNIPSRIFPQTEMNEVKKGPAIAESSVWKYLLKEQSSCEGKEKSGNPSFRKQMKQYVNSDATSECSIPPPTSCQSSKMSVVLLSEGGDMRTIFLSLLSFLSYDRGFLSDSPIVDVSLVITIDEKDLANDPKYGQRILDWGKEGTVKIVQVKSSFWDAMEKLNPMGESVIWFNGDVKKDWKLSNIRKSHSLWKENSSSIVASRLIQTNAQCRLPELHHLTVPREFLCFLDHPLMDSFRRKATGTNFDVFKSTMVLFWAVLTRGNVILSQEANNEMIIRTVNIPSDISSFFGCACSKQTRIKSVQEASSACASNKTNKNGVPNVQ